MKKKKRNLTSFHLRVLNLFAYREIIALSSDCNNSEKLHNMKRERFLASLGELRKEGLLIELKRETKKYKKNFTRESLEKDYGLVFINDDEYILNETKDLE